MKRILSVLAVLLVLFSAALPASAASPALNLSQTDADCGELAEVTLTLSDNPGIISIHASLSFDESRLELLEVKDGGILGATNHQEELSSPYVLSWENYVSEVSFNENGVLCTLVFRVKGGKDGEEIPINLSFSDQYCMMDMDLNGVNCALNGGSITVGQGKAFNWILFAAVAAVVLLAAGEVAFLILRKKKKTTESEENL